MSCSGVTTSNKVWGRPRRFFSSLAVEEQGRTLGDREGKGASHSIASRNMILMLSCIEIQSTSSERSDQG